MSLEIYTVSRSRQLLTLKMACLETDDSPFESTLILVINLQSVRDAGD